MSVIFKMISTGIVCFSLKDEFTRLVIDEQISSTINRDIGLDWIVVNYKEFSDLYTTDFEMFMTTRVNLCFA